MHIGPSFLPRPGLTTGGSAGLRWQQALGTLLFRGPGTSRTVRILTFYPEAPVLPSLYISICLVLSGWLAGTLWLQPLQMGF